jgi:hypothetical protein
MTRTCLAVLVASLCVAGCGGTSPVAVGPTASSVAVQQSDLPAGMVRCDLSGDIDSFLSKEKTADSSTYQSTKTEWDDVKSKGATAAYTAFYTDNADHCAAIKSKGPDVGSATYKLVINFVIQFKDESSAAKGYTSEKVFNVSASDLRSGGQPVVEGSKTGLSANSIVLNTPIGNQTSYIAVWQNKSFMVILAILNLDAIASKKVATSENDRIQ